MESYLFDLRGYIILKNALELLERLTPQRSQIVRPLALKPHTPTTGEIVHAIDD